MTLQQINECNTEEITKALENLEVFQIVYITTKDLLNPFGIDGETITASFRRLPKGFVYTEYSNDTLSSVYLHIEEVLNV